MKREWCFVLVIVLLCSCSNGKSPKVGSEQGTKVLIEQLEHTYQQGDWETTLLLIDSLRKMDAYGNIQPIEAECYIGLGDYDKAIALLTDVVEEGTAHNIYYHYNALGTAYYYKGDLDQAAEMYKKSIELRPTYARPYIHLGNLYAQQRDKEESIRYYLQAINLFAENQGRRTRNIHEDSIFYHHEISQLSSRESRKSRRRRVASPALVGFAECFQPDGTHKH